MSELLTSKAVNFDHSQDKISWAMGITDERLDVLAEAVEGYRERFDTSSEVIEAVIDDSNLSDAEKIFGLYVL